MDIKMKEDDENVVLHYSEDVEALIRANHEQMASRSRLDRKRDMHHVMRVPMSVIMEAERRLGLPSGSFLQGGDVAKRILQELKRPEFSAFRTYPGEF